jgi:hypothetical protein
MMRAVQNLYNIKRACVYKFFLLSAFGKFCSPMGIKKASIATDFFVGKTGFEPATPWSQTKCATGLRYFPFHYNLRYKYC